MGERMFHGSEWVPERASVAYLSASAAERFASSVSPVSSAFLARLGVIAGRFEVVLDLKCAVSHPCGESCDNQCRNA